MSANCTKPQTLKLVNGVLIISEGNAVVLPKAEQAAPQNLTLVNGVLSISGGNSIDIKGPELYSRFGTFLGHLVAE